MDWIYHCANDYCCMLFEATGDSEADSDTNKSMDHALSSDVGLAEDDAESSNCDNEFEDFDRGCCCADDHVQDGEEERGENGNNNDEGEGEDEDDEGAVVDQVKNIGTVKEKKLMVCAESVKELRNDHQQDKDKLFWETCLAS